MRRFDLPAKAVCQAIHESADPPLSQASHRICTQHPKVPPSELALISGAERLSATHHGLIDCVREAVSQPGQAFQ